MSIQNGSCGPVTQEKKIIQNYLCLMNQKVFNSTAKTEEVEICSLNIIATTDYSEKDQCTACISFPFSDP